MIKIGVERAGMVKIGGGSAGVIEIGECRVRLALVPEPLRPPQRQWLALALALLLALMLALEPVLFFELMFSQWKQQRQLW